MLEISLKNLTPEELNAAPSSFTELCRMTSVEEALALCERFGGMEFMLPAPEVVGRTRETELRLDLRSMLCDPSYKRLLSECGQTRISFPRLNVLKVKRRNRLIREKIDLSYAQKESFEDAVREVIAKYGMTRRHVYRILKISD